MVEPLHKWLKDIFRNLSAQNAIWVYLRYLLKRGMTWNDLQRPTTRKKRPTTTYNEQETTWNDSQQVRHNLQWPEHTHNEHRKDAKQPTTSRFSDYFTIWGKRFSSLTRFPPNIWLQSFERCFSKIMVKTERQASIIMRQTSSIDF